MAREEDGVADPDRALTDLVDEFADGDGSGSSGASHELQVRAEPGRSPPWR